MNAVLAAEGGYQAFDLRGGEWLVLILSAVAALLAILVGFYLTKVVMAKDEGTPKMKEIASAMPGYLGHKGFVAEDGERCTIVEFESEETHRAWAEHPGHRKAQQLGRERFYSEFSIHVCKPLKSNSFRLEGR